MYTQCPDCREAFRVTAEILQQAGGRVRCGACGHVFDALDGLSEAPPSHGAGSADEDDRSFRDTLEELIESGNVRIEDTGVEWRLVDDADGNGMADAEDGLDPADASALRWTIQDSPEEPRNDPVIPEAARGEPPGAARRQESLELEASGEERYDDNTPLPGLLDDEEEDEAPSLPGPPRRRAEDFIEARSTEFDERQVDLALGEPEEWTDLLEEVADVDEEPTAEHLVLDGGELTLVEDDPAAAGVSARETAADHGDGLQPVDREDRTAADDGLELVAEDDRAAANDGLELVDEEDRAEADGELRLAGEEVPAAADRGHHVPAPTEEEMTINRLIDQDLLRLTGATENLAASGARATTAPPPHVETIIMEGEFVQSSLHGDVAVPEPVDDEPAVQAPASETLAEAAGGLKDTYARMRERVRPHQRHREYGRYPAVAAAALLGLLLAAQLVHAYRESLATYGAFNQTVGAVYRRLGAPITPDWDINSWQFEGTSGSTDAADTLLTITSRIANRSPRTLPYPLLHVSLTDRYEEVVGSELLEPARYLEIRSAQGIVEPGEKFTATFTIAPLPANATGFKLNVCYPLAGTELRCATGAFKAD